MPAAPSAAGVGCNNSKNDLDGPDDLNPPWPLEWMIMIFRYYVGGLVALLLAGATLSEAAQPRIALAPESWNFGQVWHPGAA